MVILCLVSTKLVAQLVITQMLKSGILETTDASGTVAYIKEQNALSVSNGVHGIAAQTTNGRNAARISGVLPTIHLIVELK